MDNQSLINRISLLRPETNLGPEAIIWISAEGTRYTLSRMETSHLIYIVRLVVNRWAEMIGVEPIHRVAASGYKLRRLNFEKYPLDFFLIRTRIFTLEIFRRLDAGDQLSPSVVADWEEVKLKILECLADMPMVEAGISRKKVNELFDAEFPGEAERLKELHG